VSKTASNLLGCGLIRIGHRDLGTFHGQPGGAGPADTEASTGDNHRSTGEASNPSFIMSGACHAPESKVHKSTQMSGSYAR
jgi:hypothetical protein